MNQNIESRIQDDHVCMLCQEEQCIPFKQWKPVFDPSKHIHIMETQWQPFVRPGINHVRISMNHVIC